MSKTVSSLLLVMGMTVGVNSSKRLAIDISNAQQCYNRQSIRDMNAAKRIHKHSLITEEIKLANKSIENALASNDSHFTKERTDSTHISYLDDTDYVGKEFKNGIDISSILEQADKG